MANTNAPFGLRPVCHLDGSPYNGQARLYSIASSYAVALAIGDPVISSGTSDTNGIPGIALAAATGPIRGVIVGLGTKEGLIADPSKLDSTVRAASTVGVGYALVVDDPTVIFEVQEVGTGTALAATEIGLNTNLVLGANNGYVSGWQVDNNTEDVTATLQVRLLGLVRRPGNAFGLYAKHLVMINAHELRVGQVGL